MSPARSRAATSAPRRVTHIAFRAHSFSPHHNTPLLRSSSASKTPTSSATVSLTPSPSDSPTSSPTPSISKTSTPSLTATPSNSATPTLSFSNTPSQTPTQTSTRTPTSTMTPTPSPIADSLLVFSFSIAPPSSKNWLVASSIAFSPQVTTAIKTAFASLLGVPLRGITIPNVTDVATGANLDLVSLGLSRRRELQAAPPVAGSKGVNVWVKVNLGKAPAMSDLIDIQTALASPLPTAFFAPIFQQVAATGGVGGPSSQAPLTASVNVASVAFANTGAVVPPAALTASGGGSSSDSGSGGGSGVAVGVGVGVVLLALFIAIW